MKTKPLSKYYLMVLFLVFISYQAPVFASVASVIFAKGEVYAVDLQKQKRSLHKKSTVEKGDTIVTKKGNLELRFIDGGIISFYDNTEFKIEDYQFSKHKKNEEKAFFRFIKGMYRTVLGSIKKERYQVKTNIASIGTRGTAYRAIFNKTLQVDVFEGVVIIKNQSGNFEVPAGRSVLISDNVTQPFFLEIDNRGYHSNKQLLKGKRLPPLPPLKLDTNKKAPPQNNERLQSILKRNEGVDNSQKKPAPQPAPEPPPPANEPSPVRDKEALPTAHPSDITIENILNGSIPVDVLNQFLPVPQPPSPPLPPTLPPPPPTLAPPQIPLPPPPPNIQLPLAPPQIPLPPPQQQAPPVP